MIQGLNHINLAVCHLSSSFDFYKDILDFRPLCRWPQGAYFLAGDVWFCLFEDPIASPGKGYTHLAFSISANDFPIMAARLQKANVPLWKVNASEGESLYFLDPDGYQLELHVGDWRTRMTHKKQHPWEGTIFYPVI